ncbi:hypothetical protein RJ640_007143 [Escallonia rubra]|uniref:Leucine-rich repeat-containing N-terminal plant-type domain-containing protein n=1 Tax=Escallonia rubra TaxID=112253 RepID=A0AA88UAE5_9ASTE|nr:hypothetical protein RJ640_007143 [Escallonia rubra]
MPKSSYEEHKRKGMGTNTLPQKVPSHVSLFESLPLATTKGHYLSSSQYKQSLNNPTQLAAWKPTTDCCDWNDVMCDLTTKRITTLQFGWGNISGQFPATVDDLLSSSTGTDPSCPKVSSIGQVKHNNNIQDNRPSWP